MPFDNVSINLISDFSGQPEVGSARPRVTHTGRMRDVVQVVAFSFGSGTRDQM